MTIVPAQSEENGRDEKPVGKSFRVDQTVARRPDELAEKEGVSVNVVANRALRKCRVGQSC